MKTLIPLITLLLIILGTNLSLSIKITIFILYISTVRYFRYRYAEINEQLFKTKQYQKINLNIYKDFPLLYEKSLELAIFMTYAIPSISQVLQKSKGFCGTVKNCISRIEDTSIIMTEILVVHSQERRKYAIQRMNFIHSHFKSITNEDMLYVLALFLFPPIHYINKYDYRKLTNNEQLAIFYNLKSMGEDMGITQIPETFEKFESFFFNYRKYNIKYSENNLEVLNGSIQGFFHFIPQFLRPTIKYILMTLSPPEELVAFKDSIRPKIVVQLLMCVLGIKNFIIKYLLFPRPDTYFMNLNSIRITPGKDPKNNYKLNFNYVGTNYKQKEGYFIDQLGSYDALAKPGVVLEQIPQYKNHDLPIDPKYFDKNVEHWVLP